VKRLVYVSGAPGAGKSSLAAPLAAELGFALITKDRIKETLHDALGAPEPDLAWSRRLGAAAMELLWALAADAPAVVIEANFRPYSEYQRARLSGLAAVPSRCTAGARRRSPPRAMARGPPTRCT
jgi:predicted kinase